MSASAPRRPRLAFLAHRDHIEVNQNKLDRILANQKTITVNQAKILANQKKILGGK